MHLFEFEDLGWFPNWMRVCMTRNINTMHKLLGSADEIAGLLANILAQVDHRRILDLCSGSGGPMPAVIERLKARYGFENVPLILSDLYPNPHLLNRLNGQHDPQIRYYEPHLM